MSLPNTWLLLPIADVCDVNPTASHDLKDEELVSFLPMKAIDDVNGTITDLEERKLSEVKKGYTSFQEEDVIFAKITPCMENGKATIARHLTNSIGYGSTEFHILRPQKLISGQYLHYFIRQHSFRAWAKNSFMGSGGQQRVPTQFFKYAKIPIPPLEEQEEITNILYQAETLLHLRQNSLDKANKLAVALFIEMFGDPEPKHNQKWEVVSISKYFDVGTGGTPKRESLKNYDGNIPWAKSTDLKLQVIYKTEETISEEGLNSSNTKVYPENTILLAMYGQGKTRGHTAKLGKPAACNQACAALIPLDENEVTADYLWFWLQSSYERIRSLGRGGQQENLNLQIVKSLNITKPPISVQKEFTKRIQAIEGIKSAFDKNSTLIESFTQLIRIKSFNGDLTKAWREKHSDLPAPVLKNSHIDIPVEQVSVRHESLFPIQRRRKATHEQLSDFQKTVWNYLLEADKYVVDNLPNIIAELPDGITLNDQSRLRTTLATLTTLGLIVKVSVQNNEGGYTPVYRVLRDTDEHHTFREQESDTGKATPRSRRKRKIN